MTNESSQHINPALATPKGEADDPSHGKGESIADQPGQRPSSPDDSSTPPAVSSPAQEYSEESSTGRQSAAEPSEAIGTPSIVPTSSPESDGQNDPGKLPALGVRTPSVTAHDDVELLLRGATASVLARSGQEVVDSATLNAMLDSALAEGATGEQPAPGPKAGGVLGKEADPKTESQDEIDQLLEATQAITSQPPSAEPLPRFAPLPPEPPPEADSPPEQEGMLHQGDLDALLGSPEADQPIPGTELDSLLDSAEPAESDRMDLVLGSKLSAPPAAVAQEELDALLSGHPMTRDSDVQGETEAESGRPPEDPLERAARTNAEEGVGRENLAAAVPGKSANDALLDQGLLDSLVAQAAADAPSPEKPSASAAHEVDAAPPSPDELAMQPAALSPPPKTLDDMAVQLAAESMDPLGLPSTERLSEKDLETLVAANRFRRRLPLKSVVSIAAGLVVGGACFAVLWSVRARIPDPATLSASEAAALDETVKSAQAKIEQGDYVSAMKELAPAIQNAAAGTRLDEARFTYVEASYRSLPAHAADADIETVMKNIDDIATFAPNHPRITEALRWKAELYRRSGVADAARSTYDLILSHHSSAPDSDRTLYDAARLAFDLRYTNDAVSYLVKLLERHPGSPLASDARLLLGDCLRQSGKLDEAREVYRQVAVSQTHTATGATAATRIAAMESVAGRTEEAIRVLEARLQTATTIEGNDRIYIDLARAYRAAGDLDKAEQILRELMNFFPDTDRMPDAYIELSRVLDARGDRRQALYMARQGVERYPDHPGVIRNHAELLSLSGDERAAADALLSVADKTGQDPDALLAAGRKFAAINETQTALTIFDQLVSEFPSTSQALDARIEAARIAYTRGNVAFALQQLNHLLGITGGKPQQVEVNLTMGEIYRDLDLTQRARDAFERAASATQDPVLLGRAAAGLLDVDAVGPALPIIRRIDLAELPPEVAYRMWMSEGGALLKVDANQAIDAIERAFQKFPDLRRPDDYELLLDACLRAGRTARARALVMDLDAYVQAHPDEAPRLHRASVAWGDALYKGGDYRGAAEAYAIAAKAGADTSEDTAWAMYQRANALVRIADFTAAIQLFDELGASGSTWAEDAKLRARHARLEQRLRGGGRVPVYMREGG